MSEIATAPAAPVAAAPVAAAPAVERNFTAMMDKVAHQTTIADAPAPVVPQVQLTKEAPVAPVVDAPAAEAPEVPVAEVPADGAEAAPEVAAPEMVGEITSEEDGLKLTAERNADGTFKTKLDPSQKFDFAIRDQETGETRSYSKTIPELMRMAKDGIWAQKVRTEVSSYREHVPRLQQHVSTLEQQLADQQELNRELLTADDSVVIRHREAYQSEMSPEKVAARENAELRRTVEEIKAQTQRSQLAQRSQSFLTTRGLTAVIQDAESKLGAEVVAGKLALATTPLMVNGVIPEKHWPALEAHIKGPFQQWVAAKAAAATQQSREAALATKATADAQRKAQATVNDTTRTLIPVGRAAPDAPPEPTKPKNAQDAISRMVNRPLPATVQNV